MKYNPKINERTASLDGFAKIHPLCGDAMSQGALRLMYELNEYLCAITGMSAFTLSPAAGAHGELTGVMVVKKYFEHRGENRRVVLIPDSAHGTNPASVTMCGFEVREVPSTPDGDVDMRALRGMVNDNVAAMMQARIRWGWTETYETDVLHASALHCDGEPERSPRRWVMIKLIWALT